jgi:hypothetical protein
MKVALPTACLYFTYFVVLLAALIDDTLLFNQHNIYENIRYHFNP